MFFFVEIFEKSKIHISIILPFCICLPILGFGVVQGLTSIVTETYEGVANDGLSGFFSGLTWGLIGTVSKPALGVLDLATGAATAVKESSRSKYRELPPKLRPPRYICTTYY